MNDPGQMHLSSDRLGAFARGEVGDEDLEAIEAHLAGCEGCCTLLQEVFRTDPLLQRLRAAVRPRSMAEGPGERRTAVLALLHGVEGVRSSLTLGPAQPPANVSAPERVDRYRVLGEVGRGGMGVVYRAHDERLNRPVALKMILAGEFASTEQTVRFRLEAEMVARVRHPNIVQVYEIGQWQGRPFLALEWVNGHSLAARLREGPLTPEKAARLVERLARAVHSAHLQGVVHRDLKPANILLQGSLRRAGPGNPEVGQPRIIDFGLARLLSDERGLTRSGAVLGTPEYMAPEQARDSDVGPAADIHALGAILYECLTGQPPYHGLTPLGTVREVLERDPIPPRRLVAAVPVDLETICLKCLEKEPGKRFASAEALAADLERWRRGEPIQARRVGSLERLGKWAWRRPAPAALLGLIVLLAGIGFPGVTWLWLAAAGARNLAEFREREAALARDEARRQREASRLQLADLQLLRGLDLARAGEPEKGVHWILESLQTALSLPGADALAFRRLARANLDAWAARTVGLRHLFDHNTVVQAVASSPCGRIVVTATEDLRLHRWDAVLGRALGPPIATPSEVLSLAFSPDGKTLLLGTGSRQAQAVLPRLAQCLDASTGRPTGPAARHDFPVWSVAFSPDGRVFATGSGASHGPHGQVRLYETHTGRLMGEPVPFDRPIRMVTFHPEGRTLLAATGSLHQDFPGELHLLDVQTRQRRVLAQSHYSNLYDACFHPGGRGLVSAGSDTLRFRDADTAAEAGACLFTRDISVGTARYTPDGSFVVLGELSGVVRVRHVPTWGAIDGRGQHEGRVLSLAVSPDGTAVTTCGEDDRTARIWDLPRLLSQSIEVGRSGRRGWMGTGVWEEFRWAVCSPDHRTILVWGNDGTARLFDAVTGVPVGRPLEHGDRHVSAAAFAPSGNLVATTAHGPGAVGTVLRLWNARTGEPRSVWLRPLTRVRALAFRPDGHRFATGDDIRHVRIWDVATGQPVGKPLVQRDVVLSLRFAPDGRTLAVGTAHDSVRDPQARLWDVERGEPLSEPLRHDQDVVFLAFSGDGRTLVTGSKDSTFRLWDAVTGTPRGPARTLTRGWSHAAVSPNGWTLAAGSHDGVVRLWNLAQDAPVPGGLLLPARETRAEVLAFDPSGTLLAVGHRDGTAQLWDLTTRRPLGPPVRQRGRLIGVCFSPDGRKLRTTSDDGTMRSWPVPVLRENPVEEADLELLRQALEARTMWRLESGQTVTRLTPAEWARTRPSTPAPSGTFATTGAAAWHEACLSYAEQDGDGFAARWHLERLTALRPDRWDYFLRQGRLHHEQGDRVRALAAYQRAEQRGARGALEAWFRHRVVTLRGRQDWSGVLWYLDRLIERVPGEPTLHVERLRARLARGGNPAADIDRLLDLCRDPELLGTLAEACARAGEWVGAARLQEAASGIQPPGVEGRFQHALVTLRAADVKRYQALCDHALATPGVPRNRQEAGDLARLCSLGPRPQTRHSEDVLDRIVRLLDEAGPDATLPERRALFALLVRLDRFREALARVPTDPVPDPWREDGLRVLAHQGLRQHAEAVRSRERLLAARPEGDPARFWSDVELAILTDEVRRNAPPDPGK